MAHDGGKRISPAKRTKLKGRSGIGPPFLRLYRFMVESPEFAALSPIAVKLLVDLGKRYKGYNNGDLSVPWSNLSKEGWSSEHTMRRALHELLATGFLVCTRQPLRKRCGLYAITWEPVDLCEGKCLEVAPSHKASHLWRNLNCHHGCK